MSLLSLLRHAPRTVVFAASTVTMSVAFTTLATPASAAVPKSPKFGASIENLSAYQPQTKCTAKAQPGVVKFRALILATYKGTGDDGIVRGCKVGGTSEHKEGRAWDWAVSVKKPAQVAQVHALLNWLFATDAYGHKYAMARRLGIMYIIWNKKIWGTYATSKGWRPYSCSGVTLCHQNHVHFSFSRAGASGKTSYWTKVVVNVGGTPGNSSGGSGNGSGGSGTPPTNGGDGAGAQPSGPPALADSQLPKKIAVSTSDDVVTPYALKAGHHYLLTVSGSYTYASVRTSWSDGDRTPLVADAECLQQPQWSDGGITTAWTSTPSYRSDYSDVLLDLSVNSSTAWTPTTDDGNGCNPTDHRYVMHLTPTRTAPLYLHVVGGGHTSGSGTFNVTVTRDGS